MVKPSRSLPEPVTTVRTRRAYFDCRFGQLHVRTAFPTTGGFDEGTTLICLHPLEASSRIFVPFLPQIAAVRSVYAPDLPGCGESDPAPSMTRADAAGAIADFAADLRLRQIDVLGFRHGAAVGLELAAARPDLVRRLVLVAVPPLDDLRAVKQESLVTRVKVGGGDDSQWTHATLHRPTFLDLADYPADLFNAVPQPLSKPIGAFLAKA